MGGKDPVTVTIVVTPLVSGLIYNTVGISQSSVDPNEPQIAGGSNSATARTWVNP